MAFQNHSECLSTFQKFKGGVMDIKNFETAYLNAGGKSSELEKEDGEYVSSKSQMGWQMWQAATAQVVPEWISVDDELPSEGDLLLGISTTKLAKFNVYQVVALDEFDDCEITHWMHLPQAPKAQEQSHE